MNRVLCLVLVIYSVAECSPMSKEELEDFSNFLLKTSQLDLQVKKGADPDFDLDENEVVSDHAWEESGKFEGDLILNDRQRRLIVENVEGLARNGLTDSTKKWPNNEVVYFIQREHFNGGQMQAIQDGIDDLARASCIKFRPYRKGDRDAVVIQGSRPGCFSQVGYQGGYQVLNLSGRHPVGRGCFRHGTVVHELLHSLGFYHMQSSPDRDDYIDVVWANIVQPARHNFRKYNSFSVSDFGVGYDYDSVLHYSRKAFSANGQDTLIPKQRGAEIGQRVGLSDKDTQKLNKMYCDANNEQTLADENAPQKPSKKKPKNEPFQGHGIGYHQGKIVVIKLPLAQTNKLTNVPSTSVFDFSKTPQVSTPEAEGYGFGKELIDSYNPKYSLDIKTSTGHTNEDDEFENKNSHKNLQVTDEKPVIMNENLDGHLLSSTPPSNLNEEKPKYVPIDEYDKNLKESYDKLSQIVKQHVYPQGKYFGSRINKDYSKFFSPSKSKITVIKNLISYSPPTLPLAKQVNNNSQKNYEFDNNHNEKTLRDIKAEDKMDYSFRTSLPYKKPYSSYTQTETPQYATREYLKGRHDFSNIYSPKTSRDENNKYPGFVDKPSSEEGNIINKNDYNIKSASPEMFYTDIVTENSVGYLKNAPNKEENNDTLLPDRQNNRDMEDRMDTSYRTSFSTPNGFKYAYVQTETPKYATLEYLKERHNFSRLYSPNKSDDDSKKDNGIRGIDGIWYNNDDADDPANHDETSHTDLKKHDRVRHGDKNYYTLTNDQGRPYNRHTNIESDEYDTGSKETEIKNYQGFLPYTDARESSENRGHAIDFDDSYDYSDVNSKSTRNLTDSMDNADLDYFRDVVNEDSKNSKDSAKKREPYRLYGAPVPVNNDWFKPNYFIPKISSEDEYSWSEEDRNR